MDNQLQQVNTDLTVETLIREALRAPEVVVDRERFLRKELGAFASPEQIEAAVAGTPLSAGVDQKTLSSLAKQSISMEANTLSSFSKGQEDSAEKYLKQMLRVMQKLAFLYGVPNFVLDADSIPDATMSKILSYGETVFGLNRAKKSVGNAAHTLVDNITGVIEKKTSTEGKKRILPFGRNKIVDSALEVAGKTARAGFTSASEVFGTMFSGGTNQLLFRANAEKLRRQFEKTVLPGGTPVLEEDNVVIVEEE